MTDRRKASGLSPEELIARQRATREAKLQERAELGPDPLVLAQERLENATGFDGKERFNKILGNARAGDRGSQEGATLRLLSAYTEPVIKVIQARIEDAAEGRSIRNLAMDYIRPEEDYATSTNGKLSLEKLGSDVVAYLTIRSILDGFHEPRREIISVVSGIATLLMHEIRLRRFKELAPGLYEYRMASFNTANYSHKIDSLSATAQKATCAECRKQRITEACEHMQWPELDPNPSDRIKIGTWLLDCVFQAQEEGLIVPKFVYKQVGKERIRGKIRNRAFVYPTNEAVEWVDARNERLRWMNPIKMPMLLPPRKWTKDGLGGYLEPLDPLIKEHGEPQPSDRNMPVVYESLNRVQATRWKINQEVLELVNDLKDRDWDDGNGNGVAGLPRFDKIPLPPKPPTEGLTPEEEAEAFRPWRRKANAIHNKNHENKLKAAGFFRTMRTVSYMKSKPAFYFPWNLDFRGRLYPISDHFHPQGSDLHRGLLTFADAKPVGPQGGNWLAVHLANCAGKTDQGRKVSKMTFKERVQWVKDAESDIIRVAEDPLDNTWWMYAADPFQFYAACCEWKRFKESGYSEKFESGLPIAMDGSCNGIQHFAAMFKDRKGGRSVNVSANQSPQDLYEDVAEKVKDLMQKDSSAEGHPLAMAWMAAVPWRAEGERVLIDRSFVSYCQMLWIGMIKRPPSRCSCDPLVRAVCRL